MSLTHVRCLRYLEELMWNGIPTCPYCKSHKATSIRNEHRYHCRYCYTSYSVTVNTLFHGSHVTLDKWFKAIFFLHSSKNDISVRQLAKKISVTNKTASSIKKRIEEEREREPKILSNIATFYAQYVRNT